MTDDGNSEWDGGGEGGELRDLESVLEVQLAGAAETTLGGRKRRRERNR